MALADQLNPDRYNRILNGAGNDRTPASKAHNRLRWLWLWPLAAALVFWWAGWGWGDSGGWWFSHNRSANSEPQPNTFAAVTNPHEARQQASSVRVEAARDKLYTPVSGSDIIASREKIIYVGKRFQASGIPIQRRINARVLWIGQGTPMLAIVKGTASAAAKNAGPGEDVNATGIVRQAPPPNQAKQKFSLSDEDMAQLEQQGAYIELSQLTAPEKAGNR